ncbi:MAG: MoxR family ATPase [Candidatus Eisenbacteria bacterium]
MHTRETEAAAGKAAIAQLAGAREKILEQVRRVIVGQDRVIDELLLALFADGHGLLVGVPGLAKTLLISTFARIFDLRFNRIQFTPDLMPSDITGTEILEENRATGQRTFKFVRGPIFANLILADEINRTPPKTQAALLQAMQEKQVTTAGETYSLDLPFFVLATQNPIELEGTYPLPEAQLDRFMFNILVDYPDERQEVQIVTATTGAQIADVERVMSAAEIIRLQQIVRRVPVSDPVVHYAVRLARATRPTPEAPEFIRDWVAWGAGPRASQYLILGAKARAILMGRETPAAQDVKAVAPAVFRHRLVTNFNAEAEGVKPDRIVEMLLEKIPERA